MQNENLNEKVEEEVVEEKTPVEEHSKIVTMEERDMNKMTKKQLVVKIITTTLVYLFLGIIALIVLFPFYWMIISSLKDLTEYMRPVPTFFPEAIKWSNYADAFNAANLGTLFLNTVFVGLVSTILSTISISPFWIFLSTISRGNISYKASYKGLK